MNAARCSIARFAMQRHTSATSRVIRYRHDRLLCRRFASHGLAKEMDESVPPILRAPKLSEEQRQKRLKFLEAERDWDALVQWVLLSDEEKEIVRVHKQACMNGHFTYEDPKTKYKVMTRLKHYLRGTCCGNACRHCVFGHVNVPEDKKEAKTFNSAFWVEK